MPDATPVVVVVDDDVSVRESLELLIRCAGWQPETFASSQEFLARPRISVPSCPYLTFPFQASMASTYKGASPLNGPICRSSSSRAMAMCP